MTSLDGRANCPELYFWKASSFDRNQVYERRKKNHLKYLHKNIFLAMILFTLGFVLEMFDKICLCKLNVQKGSKNNFYNIC